MRFLPHAPATLALASLSILGAGSCLAQAGQRQEHHKAERPSMPLQIGNDWQKTSVCIQDNYSGYAINVQLVESGKVLPAVRVLQYKEKDYFTTLATNQFKISLVKKPTVYFISTFATGTCYQVYYDKASGKMKAAAF